MMMKRCFWILGVLSLLSTCGWAQEINVLYTDEETFSEQRLRTEVVQSPLMANTMLTFDDRYKGIVGSPYFLNNWTNGRVVSKSGDVFEHPRLGLNLELNYLQSLDENGRIRLLDKSKVSSFSLYDSTSYQEHRFERIPIDDTREYCKVLYQGKTTLYNCLSKLFVKAEIGGGYSTGNSFDEYVLQEAFVVAEKGIYQRVKNNRKSVLKAFPEQIDALKRYIKENAIYFKETDDLIQVVRYYDRLE